MVIDGTSFLRRAQRFFVELAANRYPNAVSLAEQSACSKNTAQRTIYRLRDEYLVPLDYDPSEKGYFLKDPAYVLPALLPPGKDELIALLLAREFVQHLDAADLNAHLERLWVQFAASNPFAAKELEPITKVFSCDSTVIGDIADSGILNYISAATTGESVRVRYRSPWRHTAEKTYEGRLLRVHFSDGNLYLLLAEKSGRECIFNAAFVLEFAILNESLQFEKSPRGSAVGSENWLDGFGVWAGESLQQIRIEITAPASRYYAAQRWHSDQEDTWDGDVLIRTFPGIPSPEVVRRILSLGKFVRAIEPPDLAEQVFQDAWFLVQTLQKMRPVEKIS